ncbi:MAG: hypothetical protein RMJ57_01615, partial [Bacteroidia bacterium]|nr:hypothetical protein [Bacteroidia bacterium]
EQQALMNQRFSEQLEYMNKRFEDVAQRLVEQLEYMNKRFEDLNQRLVEQREYADKRFEELHQRFKLLLWFIGGGFTLLTLLMSLYEFLH